MIALEGVTALENELEQLRRLQEEALGENAKLLAEQRSLDAKYELVCAEKKALAERLAALEVAGSERSSTLTSPAPSLLPDHSRGALSDQLCDLHSSTIMRLELDVERLKNELELATTTGACSRGILYGAGRPTLVDKAVSCTNGPTDSANELVSQVERWKRLYSSQLADKRRFALENEELVRQNRRLQSLRCKVNDYVSEVETQVSQLNSVIELFCCSPERQLLQCAQPKSAVPVLEASALERSPSTAATVRVSSFEALLAQHRQQQHQHTASDSGLESSPEKRSDSSAVRNSDSSAASLLNSSLSSPEKSRQQFPIGSPESGIGDAALGFGAPSSSNGGEKYTYAPYCPTCHSKLVLLREKAISVIPDLINSTTSECTSTPRKPNANTRANADAEFEPDADAVASGPVTRARLALHSLQATLSADADADEPDGSSNSNPAFLKRSPASVAPDAAAPAFNATHERQLHSNSTLAASTGAGSGGAPISSRVHVHQRAFARAMKREHSAERSELSPALETILSDSQESDSDADSEGSGSATPTGELLIEGPPAWSGPGARALTPEPDSDPDATNPLERLEIDRPTPVSSSNLSEFLELEVAALNEENIDLKQRLESLQQALAAASSAHGAASSASTSTFSPDLTATVSSASALVAPLQAVDVIVCASEASKLTAANAPNNQPPPVPPHAGALSLSLSRSLEFSSSANSPSSQPAKSGPPTANASSQVASCSSTSSVLLPPPVSVLVPVHASPSPAPQVAHADGASQTETAAAAAIVAHAGVQCSLSAEQQQRQQAEAVALAEQRAEARLQVLERELDKNARLLALRDGRIGELEDTCSQLEASHERDLFELKQYKACEVK